METPSFTAKTRATIAQLSQSGLRGERNNFAEPCSQSQEANPATSRNKAQRKARTTLFRSDPFVVLTITPIASPIRQPTVAKNQYNSPSLLDPSITATHIRATTTIPTPANTMLRRGEGPTFFATKTAVAVTSISAGTIHHVNARAERNPATK